MYGTGYYDGDNDMFTLMKSTFWILLILFSIFLFVSCEDSEDPFFHTVEFDSDGGTEIEAQITFNGNKIEKPDEPIKDGYEFIGWYIGDKEFDFETKITKDCTLTAKWLKIPPEICVITFDLGEGGSGTFAVQLVRYKYAGAKPFYDPKRPDAIFKYWSKDGSTEYTFDTPITEDITLTAVWKTTFEIGEIGPAGGYIFYDAGKTVASSYIDKNCNTHSFKWRYLEAAPEDIGTAVFGYERWGGSNRIIVSENRFGYESVGTGRYNTTKIVLVLGEEAFSYTSGNEKTTVYAAKLCDDYTYGGYDDWFLPNIDELELMNANLKKKGIGTWENANYWSSTENAVNFVWSYSFEADSKARNMKYLEYCVRACRAF